MNVKAVFNTLGKIAVVEGVLLVLPLIVSLIYSEFFSAAIFALTIAFAAAVGGILTLLTQRHSHVIYAKEGFTIVAGAWILISLIGALPFKLSGNIPSYIDAFFETVSGFTTTGASILTDIESLPRGMLFWRSFTHFIGGMGFLVFVMAIIPNITDRSIHILKAEVPGPAVGKLVPKIKDTAKILYLIYVAITLLEIIMLICGGMPVFDSVVHSFGTAGTGGFGIKSDSITSYNAYCQWVIGVFMMLFGINFNIYYLVLMRKFKDVLKSSELWGYITIMLVSTVIVTLNNLRIYGQLTTSSRHSFFQVSSIMTTTGFATADFDRWPQLSRVILVLLMILGASAGSTGGGIKMARVLILFKSLHNSIQKMLHSRCIKLVKLDGKTVDHATIREVNVFMSAYLLFCGLSMLVISAENFSFDTTVTSVLACINNIGPGLGTIGPSGNYAAFSDFSKIVLTLDMLIGRLEIFPMLMLFSPSVWKRGQ